MIGPIFNKLPLMVYEVNLMDNTNLRHRLLDARECFFVQGLGPNKGFGCELILY